MMIKLRNLFKTEKKKKRKRSQPVRMETEVISAKLLSNYDELIGVIKPFATAVMKKEDFVLLKKTETLDIERKPILSWRMAFTPTQIKVSYSIPPRISRKERELRVWRRIIKILYLTTSKKIYDLDMNILPKFLHITDESLEVFTTPYSKLRLQYEENKIKISELRNENGKNRGIMQEQSKELHRLESENTALRDRIGQLEGMSDRALMGLILRHLKNNGGTISPVEFARQQGTSIAKVEECLNMLIHKGNVELIE